MLKISASNIFSTHHQISFVRDNYMYVCMAMVTLLVKDFWSALLLKITLDYYAKFLVYSK